MYILLLAASFVPLSALTDICNSSNTSLREQSQWWYKLLKICISLFHQEVALRVHGTIGICAMICHRLSIRYHSDCHAIWILKQNIASSVAASVSLSVSLFLSPCQFLFTFVFDMANILLIPEVDTR